MSEEEIKCPKCGHTKWWVTDYLCEDSDFENKVKLWPLCTTWTRYGVENQKWAKLVKKGSRYLIFECQNSKCSYLTHNRKNSEDYGNVHQ